MKGLLKFLTCGSVDSILKDRDYVDIGDIAIRVNGSHYVLAGA